MTATNDVNRGNGERLTMDEAVKLCGRSRNAVMRWVKLGEIRAWRVGGRVEVARDDVMAFKAGKLIGPAPVPAV